MMLTVWCWQPESTNSWLGDNTHRRLFLPTDVATELGITDERKADERFPSGMSSVKTLPTNSESQTNIIVSSVKL
jgi:hypothetical protein